MGQQTDGYPFTNWLFIKQKRCKCGVFASFGLVQAVFVGSLGAGNSIIAHGRIVLLCVWCSSNPRSIKDMSACNKWHGAFPIRGGQGHSKLEKSLKFDYDGG